MSPGRADEESAVAACVLVRIKGECREEGCDCEGYEGRRCILGWGEKEERLWY